MNEKPFVKLAKFNPNPVHTTVLVLRVIENPMPKPLSFTAVMLEDTLIPYIFKKPGKNSSNTVMSPVVGEVPIMFEAGVESHYFSMYKAPKIVEGGFYRMEDVFFEMYSTAKDPVLSRSFTCARMTPINVPDIQALMCKLPFSSRSVNIERDIPPEDRLLYSSSKKDKNHFLYIKIDTPHPADGPLIYGKFTPPAPGEPVVSMYIPNQKSANAVNGVPAPNSQKAETPVIALTGGRRNESVVDNQLMLQQTNEHGQSVCIIAFTKLFEGSLHKFQVDWVKFAPLLIPMLKCHAFAVINREKTKDIQVDDSDVFGAISVYTYTHPIIVEMAKSIGFKCNWEGCMKLAPELAKAENMISDLPQINLMWADGINILGFNGDVSLMQRASEEGYVELYVFTNRMMHPDKRVKLQNGPQNDFLEYLMDSSEYVGVSRINVIYAICTAKSTFHIKDFVAGPNRKPLAAKLFEDVNVKRAHVEEEYDGDEIEE